MVNRQSQNYDWFVESNNAPRGVLVSKGFNGIFSDPDGDRLTYAVSITGGDSQLVELLHIHEDGRSDVRATQSDHAPEVVHRVWFRAEAEADWKAITPTLPDRPVVTVTLTATDPDGLSASVSGDFLIGWESYPEVVSATGGSESIQLTYDWEVEETPAPDPRQFTVNVVNADGSEGTIEVNRVSVNGKVLRLELAKALEAGQTVNVDYAYDYHDDTPLRRAGGGHPAPGFTGLAVELSLPDLPEHLAVTGVAISSDAGDDDTYTLGDTIRVTLTFNQAVSVTGTPRLKIDLDPVDAGEEWADYSGERWADYAGGNGTDTLEFTYTVAELDISTQGVALLANTLELNGGAIRPARGFSVLARTLALDDGETSSVVTTNTDATLAHSGLGHNPAHKVDTSAPSLRSVELTGTTLTLTFSETLDEDAIPPASAFTVKKTPQEGDEQVVNLNGSPTIDGAAVTLTLANAPLDSDTDVKVSYAKPASGADNKLRDLAGNEVASFTDQAAGSDLIPPTLVRGEVNRNTLTFYFSEPLDEDSVGGHFRVTLRIDDPPIGWYNFAAAGDMEINGNKVVVGTGVHHRFGRFGVQYELRARVGLNSNSAWYIRPLDPTAAQLRDLSGNMVHAPYSWGDRHMWTGYMTIDNITPLPAFESATVTGNRLTLTIDDMLDEGSAPASSAFTVSVNGNAVRLANVNPVAVDGDTVTLTLAWTVSSMDTVTVSYAKPSSSRLRNVVHENVDDFSDQPVTNLTPVGAPTLNDVAVVSDAGSDDTYALDDVIHIRLTFNEAVNVTGVPRLKIKMDPGYGEKWAAYASGSGTNSLTFAHKVVVPNYSPQGIAVLANTLELNGGAIRSTATTPLDAYLTHVGLAHDSNHKVDSGLLRQAPGSPSVTGLAISSDAGDDEIYALGDAIWVKLTFDKVVNVTGAPRLKIRMDPLFGEFWATYASGSGTTELTFGYTVVAPNYSAEGVAVMAQTLELNGGAIRSTATPPVDAYLAHAGLAHNPAHMVDTTAPSLQSATMDGAVLSLTYDEPMDEGSVPTASAFTVKAGGSEVSLADTDPVAVRGILVTLTLANPALGTDTVEVSYAKSAVVTNDRLRDLAGNEAAGFTDQAAGPDTTPPALVRAEIDGSIVTQIYSEMLDENSLPATSAFRVNLVGRVGLVSPAEVKISGNTVVLDLGEHRATVGQITNTRYYMPTAPGASKLRDLAGNETPTTRIIVPLNLTKPSLLSATALDYRLTLTIDDVLDKDSVPAASAFTVKLNGTAVRLASANPVAVAEDTVTLTLVSWVPGAVITVSYAKPASDPLRNVANQEVASFADEAVTNSTP